MLNLAQVDITGSGRPVLLEGEAELMLTSKVDLVVRMRLSKRIVRDLKDGRAVVTSQRLLWLPPTQSSEGSFSLSVPLVVIRVVGRKGQWTATRLKLSIDADADGVLLPGTGADGALQFDVLLSCHGSSKHVDAFHGTLLGARRQALAAVQTGATSSLNPFTSAIHGAPQAPLSPVPPGPMSGAPSGTLSASSSIAQQSPNQIQEAKDELIAQLVAMGFNGNRAAHAANATGTVEASLEWLLQHEHDPLLDLPPLDRPYGATGPTGTHLGPRGPATPAAPGVGVAAIIKREQQKVAATDRSLDEAFKDLSALMAQAGEMVNLAQRFREQMPQLQEGLPGPEDPSAARLDEAAKALEDDLLSMGIANPVTKKTSGAAYHKELARQLSDFLEPLLLKHHGIMPLTDVYYAYNRARGTELISPDDLLAAAARFGKVNAPVQLHLLPSGVSVVQHKSYSTAHVASKVLDLLHQLTRAQEHAAASSDPGMDLGPEDPARLVVAAGPALGPSLTATQVVSELQVPVAVAGEWLATAESQGLVCRDDGPQGLRFFRNFFMEVVS